ncbi:MAG: hypothetical protein JW889_13225 [Verrucomicrobia bacterium]|nr:hypothetical protein [Verrucomicrobiota bacterium]
MGPDDEVRQLLREIRDQQKVHHDAWRQVWEETRTERQRQVSLIHGTRRSHRVWLVICVVMIAIAFGYPSMLTSCVRGLTGSHEGMGPSEKHEARAWLNQNKNEAPLASNRFDAKAIAVEFVEKLYECGAIRVYVTNVSYDEFEVKEYGGPYADSLIVELPKDKDKRAKLFAIHTAEVLDEGYSPTRDRGQGTLFFWWD